MVNKKIILFFTLITPLLGHASEKLSPSNLHNRTYRLTQGAINLCPDKLGIKVEGDGKELQIFPMEIEWEQVKAGVNPILSVRGIRSEWEPQNREDANPSKSTVQYSAIIFPNRIESLTRTQVNEETSLESHATLNFVNGKFEMVRWSVSGGSQHGEPLSCTYVENAKPPLKLAHHAKNH